MSRTQICMYMIHLYLANYTKLMNYATKITTVNVVSEMHLCGYIFIANVLLEANRILIYAWMADCYIRNTASCICQQYPTSTLFLPLMFKQQSCT